MVVRATSPQRGLHVAVGSRASDVAFISTESTRVPDLLLFQVLSVREHQSDEQSTAHEDSEDKREADGRPSSRGVLSSHLSVGVAVSPAVVVRASFEVLLFAERVLGHAP